MGRVAIDATFVALVALLQCAAATVIAKGIFPLLGLVVSDATLVEAWVAGAGATVVLLGATRLSKQ